MKHFIKFLLVASLFVIPGFVFANTTGNATLVPGPGSVNMDPSEGGVTVSATAVTGFAWGDQFGWVNFGPLQNAGVTNTCSQNGSMTLGGFAWGQNAGWINFATQNGPVTIDANGNFSGFAWSQNYGWIDFDGVNTTFRCSSSGGGGSPGGGSSGGGTMCQLPLVWNGLTCVNPQQSQQQPPTTPVQPTSPTSPVFPTPTQPNNQNIPTSPVEQIIPQPDPVLGSPLPIIQTLDDQREPSRFALLSTELFRDVDIKSVGTTLAIVGLIGALLNLPFRLGNMILAIPALRRKRRYWGTVYDTATFEPLDPAYVQLFDNAGNEIASMITDMDGRYGFLVEPGTYTLKASKTNYAFPSRARQGQTSDRYYNNLYFGESITVNQQGEVITKDIPMDPTGADWNQAEKRRMNTTRFFKRNDMFIHRIIDIFFILGLVYAIYAVIVSPIVFNIIVIAIYAVVLLINLLGHPSRAYGIVKNKDGSPSAGSVVRIHNANLGREMLHRVVGKNGYYYALTQSGDYYATVGYQQPDKTEQVVHQTDSFRSSDGVISKKIKLDI